MTDERDEFSFLPDDARDVGRTDPLPEVRRVEVDAGDGRVSALAWGPSPARVVLLHGAALNAHTWDATVLAGGFAALALDLPGHGDSAWRADGDYGPETLGPVVARALDRWVSHGLVERGATLVGQSLGGLIGAVVAAYDPGLVAHLVLVDILPLPPGAAREVEAFLAGPAEFASRDEIVARALAFGLGGGRDRLERGVHLNTRVRPDGTVVWKHHLATLGGRAVLRLDADTLWTTIEGLGIPVDLVRAGRGLLTAEAAAELTRRSPGARAVVVDAGHNIQEDAPVELAGVLTELIGRDAS